MISSSFDSRSFTIGKGVKPLSRLGSFVFDMEATCLEIEEQIAASAFRTEDAACLREAENLVARLDSMIDALMAFQKEYVG